MATLRLGIGTAVIAAGLVLAPLETAAAAGPAKAPLAHAYPGGSAMNMDVFPGGGAIIAGRKYEPDRDFPSYWLLRIDGDGEKLWEKFYGSYHPSYWQHRPGIVALPDGGAALAGLATPAGNERPEPWLRRLDGRGNTLWKKTFEAWGMQSAVIIGALPGGDLVVASHVPSRREDGIQLLRLNGRGEVVWDTTTGNKGPSTVEGLATTADGSFILIGHKATTERSLGLGVTRIGVDGRVMWNKTHKLAGNHTIFDVTASPGGGVAVAGWKRSKSSGPSDLWVLRLEATGELMWTRTFGGAKSDFGRGVAVLADGGIAVVGRTLSKGAGLKDLWVLRLDAKGNLLWDRTFGTLVDDEAYGVRALPDGGFVVAGNTYCETYTVWMLRYPAMLPQADPAQRLPGLRVARPCIEWSIRGTYRRAEDQDGLPRVQGAVRGPGGLSTVELVGPKANLVRASISFPLEPLRENPEEWAKYFSYVANYFLLNAMPDWRGSREWLGTNLMKLSRETLALTKVIDGREITLHFDDQKGVIHLSVKALQ